MNGLIIQKSRRRIGGALMIIIIIYVASYLALRVFGVLCDRSFTDVDLNEVWRKAILCDDGWNPNWVSDFYHPLFYLEIKTNHFGLPFYVDMKIWKEEKSRQ